MLLPLLVLITPQRQLEAATQTLQAEIISLYKQNGFLMQLLFFIVENTVKKVKLSRLLVLKLDYRFCYPWYKEGVWKGTKKATFFPLQCIVHSVQYNRKTASKSLLILLKCKSNHFLVQFSFPVRLDKSSSIAAISLIPF